ncbi:RNA polymerase factor sigma-54 [candidate division NPL-UPA2 bacterium]|nr:RNA polymerase factor sigma-54 [candidate division NPL-UPA2 bacterium]
MAPEFKLEQRQVQQLILSPQMQQAIYLLQLPLMELRQFLQQQLIQNPVLEEVEEMEPTATEEETLAELKKEDYEPDVQEEMERIAQFDRDWYEYFRDTSALGRIEADEEKRHFRETSITRPLSLQDYLLRQLHLSSSSPEELKIGELIVGNIDSNGYLQASVEEIATASSASNREVEKALLLIQTFDPPGVGARDLGECLLLQLGRLKKQGSLAAKIISQHLKDLEKRRYPHIAQALAVSLEKVKKAAKMIATLEPKPGGSFSSERNQTILPDLVLKKVDNEYRIIINDGDLPRLRVSSTYQKLMEKGNPDPDAKQYLVEKFKSAMWVIKSIEQRRKTVRKVAESIVKKQREFLDKGVEYFKPCTMREIADEIGMHESTVSRVTTNKYIETPQGLLELKYFFSSEVPMTNSESISRVSLKAKIQELIEKEDSHQPLSDQEIASRLAAQGIRIARRTVAKYREAIGLLPSSLRKQY